MKSREALTPFSVYQVACDVACALRGMCLYLLNFIRITQVQCNPPEHQTMYCFYSTDNNQPTNHQLLPNLFNHSELLANILIEKTEKGQQFRAVVTNLKVAQIISDGIKDNNTIGPSDNLVIPSFALNRNGQYMSPEVDH
jgi:hypothetical protein